MSNHQKVNGWMASLCVPSGSCGEKNLQTSFFKNIVEHKVKSGFSLSEEPNIKMSSTVRACLL